MENVEKMRMAQAHHSFAQPHAYTGGPSGAGAGNVEQREMQGWGHQPPQPPPPSHQPPPSMPGTPMEGQAAQGSSHSQHQQQDVHMNGPGAGQDVTMTNAEAGPSSRLFLREHSSPHRYPHANPHHPSHQPHPHPHPPPRPRLDGTQDLLIRFGLLSAYERHVKSVTPPIQPSIFPPQAQAQLGPGQGTAAGSVDPPALSALDKGKGKEIFPPPPTTGATGTGGGGGGGGVPDTPGGAGAGGGGDDDDEGGGKDKKKKMNSYRFMVRSLPGKHSMKKDTYLQDIIQIPPKERVAISKFDLRTERAAFAVGLEGLKGWNINTLVQESAQAREDRKKRKELKKRARTGLPPLPATTTVTTTAAPSSSSAQAGGASTAPHHPASNASTPRPSTPAVVSINTPTVTVGSGPGPGLSAARSRPSTPLQPSFSHTSDGATHTGPFNTGVGSVPPTPRVASQRNGLSMSTSTNTSVGTGGGGTAGAAGGVQTPTHPRPAAKPIIGIGGAGVGSRPSTPLPSLSLPQNHNPSTVQGHGQPAGSGLPPKPTAGGPGGGLTLAEMRGKKREREREDGLPNGNGSGTGNGNGQGQGQQVNGTSGVPRPGINGVRTNGTQQSHQGQAQQVLQGTQQGQQQHQQQQQSAKPLTHARAGVEGARPRPVKKQRKDIQGHARDVSVTQ